MMQLTSSASALISSAANRLFSLAAAAAAYVIVFRTASVLASCQIPDQWQGLWYEVDVGDVTITSTNVTNKGVCLQRSNSFYLFENQEIGCYTCLLIDQRHRNVLQYKESFCGGKEALETVCSTIHLETVQRTLIREPSEVTSCPLRDAYHLVYNNNSGGFCESPMSYVRPCASPAELSFHFEHCEDAAYTYKRDVNLDCLATWNEGSDLFLIGRMRGQGFHSKSERYRCFIYQIRGSVVLAAMSADSSCRGLRSPTNGPVLLELTQDVKDWPQLTCQYPEWMTRRAWRDLDAKRFYRVDDAVNVIRLHFRQSLESETSIVKSFRCHRTSGDNVTSGTFTAMAFVSNACSSQYQCIKFVRRSEVIELIEGRLLNSDEDQCLGLETNPIEGSKRILIPEGVVASVCPFEGRYHIHTGSTKCGSYLRAGCNGSSVIEIVSSCSSRPGLQLQCLLSWEENRKRVLIARTLDAKQTNCFSFRYESSHIRFSTDVECNAGAVAIFRDRVTYAMDKKPLTCDFISKSIKDLSTSMHGARNISNDNQYAGVGSGGTYGVVNATRQVRKQKTRQESATTAKANCSNLANWQRIFLLLCLSRMLIKLAERNAEQ